MIPIYSLNFIKFYQQFFAQKLSLSIYKYNCDWYIYIYMLILKVYCEIIFKSLHTYIYSHT